MARRYNELYLGNEFLNIQGRDLKHLGLISEFGNSNVNKVSDETINLFGMDLETNHKTAELKLLGIWNGTKYDYHTSDFLATLFNLVDHAFWSKGNNALCYWSKLDPFVLYKQFLLLFKSEKQLYSMKRFGKLSGEWDKTEGVWTQNPVIEVEIKRGYRTYRFGIKNAIRSSIQFYYYELIGGKCKQLNNEKYIINTLWAYDIAPLYKYRLEKEMKARVEKFPYYSKLDKSAHLVDWDRFDNDIDYRENMVLKSNRFDAMAVYDLGKLVIDDFKKSFHYYPRQLISSGAIARAAIVATLKWKYSQQFEDSKKVDRHVKNDLKAIALINFYDKWHKQLDEMSLKDMFCLFYESYSGGYIEAHRYGLIKEGYYSDIASAYIKWLTELKDLRGSTVTHGVGSPPQIDDSYCLIRGTVDIPLEVDYMPITVKSSTAKDTNVRATGTYIASYWKEERDYMLTLGATFTDEVWYNIQTLGEKSPLAEVAQDLIDLRYTQLANNDSAEYLTKTAAASLYGITYEATNTFYETDQLEVMRNGYRGGEVLNPLFASWITMKTRLQISEGSNSIVSNGGKPALLMTDCIFWEGKKDALDVSMIRDTKTLGFFETPVKFNQMACLGTGRYSYIDDEEGYITTKNRGLNIFDIHSPDGYEIGAYNWIEALKIAEINNSFKIKVKVRVLISVGMLVHNNIIKDNEGNDRILTINDLGLVFDSMREVDLVTGLTKRILSKPLKNIQDITRGSIGTESIYYGFGMEGTGQLMDQTLPILREEVMKLAVKTAKKRDLTNRSKASLKYNEKHKDSILSIERQKYKYLKNLDFKRDIAKLWCKRSWERIQNELLGGN